MIKLVTRHLSVDRSSENNKPMAEIGEMDEPHRRRSERPCADLRGCSASESHAFIW